MKQEAKLFLMRLFRSILMVISAMSFFDMIDNSKFIQNCPEYSTYKYLLLTKISLSITIISSISGILKRVTGVESKWHSFLLASASSLETIVFLLFWGLLFFDKKAIVDPNAIKNHSESTLWNRFCSHTIPFILAYLNMHDMSLSYKKQSIVFFLLFGIVYYCATCTYAHYFHRDIYPFLSKVTYFQKALIFVAIDLLAIIIYLVNLKVFGKRSKTKNKKD